MKRFFNVAVIMMMALATLNADACDRAPKNGKAKNRTAKTATAKVPKTVVTETATKTGIIDTLTVNSKMGRPIKNLVVLPDEYINIGDDTRYPVVYLLHGYDGTFTDWSQKADLAKYATDYGFIIVCPDGQDSWYFDSPIDPQMQYETYMTRELISAIDSRYRTIASRNGRAITGLSMGGHGALWLAWRHTDLYCACGSMSGGVDITKFPDKWKIQLRLGKYAENKDVWAKHSVASLVPTLKDGVQQIIIDDGDKDFFYDVNTALDKALTKQGITHRFDIRPGAHSWQYWTTSLPFHLEFFDKAFDAADQQEETKRAA